MEQKIKVEILSDRLGWSKLIFKDDKTVIFEGNLYSTSNVPKIFLDGFDAFLSLPDTTESEVGISLWFDEERSEFTIILYKEYMEVTFDREEQGIRFLYVSPYYFMQEVCSKILESPESWAYYYHDQNNSMKNMIERCEKVLKKIEQSEH